MDQQERNEYAKGCRWVSDEEFQGIVCSHVGVAAITNVALRHRDDGKYEARVGVALFGYIQNPDGVSDDADPFAEDFGENYCYGVGSTEKEALQALAENMKEMSKSLL